MTSENELGNIPFVSALWDNLRSIGSNLSLKVWYTPVLKSSGPGLLLVGMVLVTASTSLGVIGLCKLLF